MAESLHVCCPSCDTTYPSTLIQLDREEFERTAIDGNTEVCPVCGAPVMLTKETLFFAKER